MDTFKNSLEELQKEYPDVTFSEANEDVNVTEMEAMYSGVLTLLQKNADFFSTERILFGVNLSELAPSDTMWKALHMCLFSSFFHGDIKKKIGTVLSAVKSLWGNTGETNTEVERLLNDESTEDHLQEMFDYATNLRSAKVVADIIEEFDVESLGLSFDNPAELMELVRNPENPVMKKAIDTIQKLLRNKLESGHISQQQLMSDIEGIKAKVQSLFGNVFNEMMGGRRGEVGSSVMMSNSPEARRQRMLMRLQRKQREKTQR
jgi:hypothetical protein